MGLFGDFGEVKGFRVVIGWWLKSPDGDGLWEFNVSDVGLVGGVGGPQVKACAFTWGFADLCISDARVLGGGCGVVAVVTWRAMSVRFLFFFLLDGSRDIACDVP